MYLCWTEIWPEIDLSAQRSYIFYQYLPLVVVSEPRQWLLSVTSGSRCYQAMPSPLHLPHFQCWFLSFICLPSAAICQRLHPRMAGRFGLSCLDDAAPLTSFVKQPLTRPCLLGTKREAVHLQDFFFFNLFKVRFSWYKTSIMLLLFKEAPGAYLLHAQYLTGGLTFIGGRQPSQFLGSRYHSGWGYFFICRVPLCQGNIPLFLQIIAQVLHASLPFREAC